MIIRDMSLEDISDVYEQGRKEQGFSIAEDVPAFWELDTLRNWTVSDNDISLVVDDNGVKAFLLATYNATTKKGTIENTWVSADFRYKGLGRKLMAEAEERLLTKGAQYLCALVEEENIGSRNMCKRQGYLEGDKFYWMHKEIPDNGV
jgi:ribosomal protein S18 acetylase RimI-like enzyme